MTEFRLSFSLEELIVEGLCNGRATITCPAEHGANGLEPAYHLGYRLYLQVANCQKYGRPTPEKDEILQAVAGN